MSAIPAIEINKLFARSDELITGTSEGDALAQADLREVFKRTRELAVELMRDNEQLRVQNLLLERQKLETEQRFESSRIGIENEQLKAELALLNKQIGDLEKKSQKFQFSLVKKIW